jgi:hypothetical protein
LVSNGRTIYAAPSEGIVKYFTSNPLFYRKTEDSDVVDFIFDIANGTERPHGSRKAPTSDDLQRHFQNSSLYPSEMVDTGFKLSTLPASGVSNYGYFSTSKEEFLNTYKSSWTVIERALHIKFKEYEVLKKSLISSIFIALFMSYFLYNQGNFGNYTMSLLSFPYAKVTNISACMFLMIAVVFLQQILNVHILCQKIQVFRYERSAKCTPTLMFFLAAFISEIPFTVFFAMIFSNITYFLASLNTGYKNYFFYMGVHCLISIIGYTTTLMLAAVIRREIAVRNIFLFFTFMMIMTGGLIFQLPVMNDFIVDISRINCFRWAYESIMVWKYEDYPDGNEFLQSYGFNNFNKYDIFTILYKFILFDLIIFFIALIPLPNTLQRKENDINRDNSRDSHDLSDFTTSKGSRHTDLLQPNLFARESSVTGRTNLASQNSISEGFDNSDRVRGPMVSFRNVTYRVPDRKSPMGYRNILNDVTGRFDWGRLGAIMGAEMAGKSSLLNVLGGQYHGTASEISGQVLYDGVPINTKLFPWQRCAYVEALDEHFRDLTVLQILTYAMQLRCVNMVGLLSVDLNVKRTIELLKLTE